MRVIVPLNQGFLPDRFTSKAEITKGNQPIVSFPITIQKIPQNATALALSLIDYDAVPRTGFPFIHWLAANIPLMTEIPADFSRHFMGPQGQNSWMSRFYALDDAYFTDHYAGPNPPDQPHHYTLTIYALSSNAPLKNQFYYNEFLDQLSDRIIDQSSLRLLAK
ncbi:YbhB/YbcL family Raf kinase inhibitor-like protein [Levilactobacillus brevis]|uniref:YbhB/YbcL family Raf kinase inhibitor-like protein n=1 Tax=Levilactobacillus brevis TaxID=1580 RepID=UPI001BDE32D7|nr:YbhB/YbcL family Raf kinase inhibitor-like protein [Levilactobacillus brevis]